MSTFHGSLPTCCDNPVDGNGVGVAVEGWPWGSLPRAQGADQVIGFLLLVPDATSMLVSGTAVPSSMFHSKFETSLAPW